MKTYVSSGGVLYDPTQNKVCLICKIPRDEWALPKGGVEKSENLRESAMREIQEETGYKDIELKELLGKTEYELKDNEDKAFKIVYYYLALLKTLEYVATPEQEKEELKSEWLSFEEAIKKAKYADTREFVRKTQLICEKGSGVSS